MEFDVNLLPTQLKFYESLVKNIAYIGGYGSGKTRILCELALKLAVNNPGTQGSLISPTYQMSVDPVILTMEEILTERNIKYKYHQTKHKIYLPEVVHTIKFLSADRPERIKGPTLSYIGMDEAALIDDMAWKNAFARVRDPKAKILKRFIVGTPEGLGGFVYEEFVEKIEKANQIINNAKKDWTELKTRTDIDKEREQLRKKVIQAYKRINQYKLFVASTRENIFLDESYVEDLEENFSENMRVAYVEGGFCDLSGNRAYLEFSQDNLQDNKFMPELHLCIGMDFNVAPMCWILFQHHHDKIIVLDEIVIEDNATTAAAIEKAVLWYRQRLNFATDSQKRAMHIAIYGDASGSSRTTAGESDYIIIKNHLDKEGINYQLQVPNANPPVKDRLNSVNAALKNGKILIDSKAITLIRDLRLVKTNSDGSLVKTKRTAHLTHSSDALGYPVMNLLPLRMPQHMAIGSVFDL